MCLGKDSSPEAIVLMDENLPDTSEEREWTDEEWDTALDAVSKALYA
jgi:hypothetical protein